MDSNSSSDTGLDLPSYSVAMAPVFLIELLVVLCSNALLFIMLAKERDFINNVNVFLFSLATTNTLTLIPIATMLISVAASRWIFGQTLCTINQVAMGMFQITSLIIHVFISHDRYNAILRWTPYSKKSYMYVAMAWSCGVLNGLFFVWNGGQVVGLVDSIVSCYAPHRNFHNPVKVYRTLAYTGYAIVEIVHSIAVSASLYYYIRTLCQLRTIKAVKMSHSVVSYPQDAPVEWRSAVQSLKAMAGIFFFHIVFFGIAFVYYIAFTLAESSTGETLDEVVDKMVGVVIVFLYTLPATNPVLLLLSIKFRSKIRALLHWPAGPCVAASQGKGRSQNLAVSMASRVGGLIHLRPIKIAPLE